MRKRAALKRADAKYVELQQHADQLQEKVARLENIGDLLAGRLTGKIEETGIDNAAQLVLNAWLAIRQPGSHDDGSPEAQVERCAESADATQLQAARDALRRDGSKS